MNSRPAKRAGRSSAVALRKSQMPWRSGWPSGSRGNGAGFSLVRTLMQTARRGARRRSSRAQHTPDRVNRRRLWRPGLFIVGLRSSRQCKPIDPSSPPETKPRIYDARLVALTHHRANADLRRRLGVRPVFAHGRSIAEPSGSSGPTTIDGRSRSARTRAQADSTLPDFVAMPSSRPVTALGKIGATVSRRPAYFSACACALRPRRPTRLS